MDLLNISRSEVKSAPFPHVLKDGIIPEDLFLALKRDFPQESHFEEQYSETGSKGSRTGAGTGFDIYRGDAAYDRLVASSEAWAEFDAYINSTRFIDKFLETFGPDLAGLGLKAEIDPGRYDHDLVEPRDVLTANLSLRERLGQFAHRLLGNSDQAPGLFTRLDIERSTSGYAKPPHCDRANRLCSLIVYFTDMAAEGIEGGELALFKLRQPRTASEHQRHPKADEVEVVAQVVPRPNLGAFFPCSNNSYHGVSAITTPGKSRDFLYINISVDQAACW